MNVCVFCGSSPPPPAHGDAGRAVGRALGAAGLGLVYGGAGIGLMGVVADAALAAGAPVVGVIPGSMRDRELAHPGLTELVVVASMHERKALMYERSHAFLALPGGLGTLDELFEVLTWAQLGLHAKPVGLLDVGGFWEPLLAWLDRAVADGYLGATRRDAIVVDDDPVRLLATLVRP